MPAFQRLKGFRDFLPREMTARNEVFNRIEDTIESFGFHEIDTPSLESLDLFLVKSGEELVDQTYSFEDKGGRDVTLIPEQTPSRARIIANDKSLSSPMKWYSTSKRWRYENPQKGRLREFYQTDIDIFGADTVHADAEILAVTVEIMDALEVRDAVDVLANDRRLLEGILEAHGVTDTEAVMQVIDDKEKMTRGEFADELQEAGLEQADVENVVEITDINGPISTVIDEVIDLAPDDPAVETAVERMDNLTEALETYGVAEDVVLDLSIVRGLAYYTGLVFEVFDTEGDLRAVCGGGRYNELVGLFGGKEVSAIGFAIGDAVIEELMKREEVWPTEELDTEVYVLPVSEDVRTEAIAIATELRREGHTTEIDVKERNVGSQFDYADTVGADTVIVVGTRDLEQDVVTVRDMATGDEEQVPRDSVVEHV